MTTRSLAQASAAIDSILKTLTAIQASDTSNATQLAALQTKLTALTTKVNAIVVPADQAAAIAAIQAQLIVVQKEIDAVVGQLGMGGTGTPPTTTPPPVSIPTVTVSDTTSRTVTGDGTTVVTWHYTIGNFDPIGVIGPYLTDTPGTVWMQETHQYGQVLTLVNVFSVIVGATTYLMSAATIAPVAPPPTPGGGSTPTPPAVLTGYRSVQTGGAPATTGMRADVVIAATTVVFNANDGTNLGDYTNPFTGKSHKNIAVQGPNRRYAIFRPENDGSRFEVEFGWGNIFETIPADLASASVNIYNNNTLIGTFTETKHIWITNSFWESAPRPIVKNAAQLVSEHWVMPMDPTVCDSARPANAPAYIPMGISDITGYMPQTGNRPDIGLHPERTSCYIATQDASLIPSIIAWGNSAYSIPMDTTDPFNSTWAPVTFTDYPTLNFYDNKAFGSPQTIGFTTNGAIISNGVYFDGGSHLPELPYVPFLLTGDVKYLLSMQRMMTVLLSQDGYKGGILRYDNTRIYAWSLRELFNLCRVMRDMGPQPAFLLPYSYWKGMLDANLTWFSANFVNNPDPLCSVLRLSTQFQGQAFWQIDYLISVLGEGVWQGFTDWTAAFTWQLGNAIARTNGTSGWPQTVPVYYYVGIWNNYTAGGAGYNPVATWAELATLNNIVDTGTGQLSAADDHHYEALTRESLRIGAINGINVATSFNFLNPLVLARTDAIGWAESY